jgi:EAL domain-containing protein (putative c-di-GMP-specific phosphodiesterase class I)
MEALVRWRHPVRGLVSPVVFVPIAVATDSIDALFRRGLHLAAADQARLAAQLGFVPAVAVNLSARQLADRSLPRPTTIEAIAGSVDRCGLWVPSTG